MPHKLQKNFLLWGLLCLTGILAILILSSSGQPNNQITFLGYTNSAGREYMVFEGTIKERYILFYQIRKTSDEVLPDAIIKEQGRALGGARLSILLPRHYENGVPVHLQWTALKTTKGWQMTLGNFLLKHGMVSLANLLPRSMNQSDLVMRSVAVPLPERPSDARRQIVKPEASQYE